jgi:hypothetical protein
MERRCLKAASVSGLTVVVLITLACIADVDLCRAGTSILPRLQEIDAARGQRRAVDLRVSNKDDEPLQVTMIARSMEVSEDGVPVLTRNPEARTCAGWITFEPERFTLGPNEAIVVTAHIAVPSTVTGSYGSLLLARYIAEHTQTTFDIDGAAQTTLELGMAASSILFVNVRGRDNTIAIVPEKATLSPGGSDGELRVFANASDDRGWTFALSVKNDGNTLDVVRGGARIYAPGPRFVDTADFEVGRGYVMAEARRTFTAEGSKPLADGEYFVRVNLARKNGTPIQGVFPFHIRDGRAHEGEATEEFEKVVDAFNPKLELSKTWLDIEVVGGSSRQQGIRVVNRSAEAVVARPRIATFTLDDRGLPRFLPAGAAERDCTSWLTLRPDSLALEPGQGRSVRIRVAAPDTLDGEYYAAVNFVEDGLDWTHTPIESQLPRTLIITAREERSSHRSAEIVDVEIVPVGPLNRSIEAVVENRGNTHCFATGRVTIYDADWNSQLESVEFGSLRTILLPGQRRAFKVTCPGKLDVGAYKAVVEVSYAQDAERLSVERQFRQTLE